MDGKLFGSLVSINSWTVRVVLDSVCLGDALDSYVGTSDGVLGREDHTKGAMVNGSDSYEPSVQKFSILKAIAHTLHLKDFTVDEMLLVRADPASEVQLGKQNKRQEGVKGNQTNPRRSDGQPK